jgi:hypothetical protein
LIKINKKKELTLESSNKVNTTHKEKLDDENTKININFQPVKLIEDEKELKDKDETKELKTTTSFKYLMDNLETKQTLEDDYALEITDLDVISENSAPLELKSHESIYLEIYKKAKQKAKEIRRNAVEAFLEAKNIKLKYNLTNIVNDSSSDEDN